MWYIAVIVVIVIILMGIIFYCCFGKNDDSDDDDDDYDDDDNNDDDDDDKEDKTIDAKVLFKKLHSDIMDMSYDDFLNKVPEGSELQYINIKALYETKKAMGADPYDVSLDDYKEALNMC